MGDIEKAYWNNNVSKQLEIGESTLRKWCIELEENGYEFKKGTKGTRAFTDHDIAALMYFKNLTRAKNHTMKQAAIAVIDKYSKGGNEEKRPLTMEKIQSELNEKLESLLDHAKKQEDFNKSLLDRLERQDIYIKKLIEKNIKD